MSTVCIIRHREYGELGLRREAEALRDAGHEVHVVCLRDAGPTASTVDGIHVHALPMGRRRASTLRYLVDYLSFFLATAGSVALLHVRHHFDVVQVTTMPDVLVFATIPAKLMGVKVIVFMKEPTPELGAMKLHSPWWSRLLVLAEQAAIRYADLTITVTEQLKQAYVERGADPERIRVVLNGPGAAQFPETVAGGVDMASDRRPVGFTLLCHGSIEERYGHDTILRAVDLARRSVPGLRLRVTGEGPRLEELRQLATDLGVHDHVEFLGWVSLEQIVEELRGADVGIVAQRSSPYSNLVHTNKMYEYILFDTPVISTRLRSVAAYFSDDCIEFVPADDPTAMGAAIVRLFEQPERRTELVRNARRRYEVLGWEQQSRLLLAAYDEVIAS